MLFSLFTKKKKNTDYNEMDAFCDDIKETTLVSDDLEEKQENKDGVIKKARNLLKDAIKIFT